MYNDLHAFALKTFSMYSVDETIGSYRKYVYVVSVAGQI